MNIFNGLIGFSLIYAIWGGTYFFSWYGLYDNPHDLTKMRNSVGFVFVPGAFFVASLMFFCLGFVSTFSLIHNKGEGEKMTIHDALMFIVKRIVKLIPFNLFIIGFGTCLAPYMGGGPYWDLYEKAMTGCNNGYWWTNLVYIHNFYPSQFDEKCMGWTWFISCYVQLSIILPFLIAIYSWIPRIASGVIFGLLFIGSFVLNGVLVHSWDTGIFLKFDNDYFFNYDFY
jgi:hypothetical protein